MLGAVVGIGSGQYAFARGAGMTAAVECGSKHAFIAREQGLFGKAGHRATTAGFNIGKKKRFLACIPEPEGELNTVALADGAKVFQRIQPFDGGIVLNVYLCKVTGLQVQVVLVWVFMVAAGTKPKGRKQK